MSTSWSIEPGRSWSIEPGRETPPIKPLAVTVKVACKIAGIGHTKMWELIGNGTIASVSIGRRLVLYQSLEEILTPRKSKSRPTEIHKSGEVAPSVG